MTTTQYGLDRIVYDTAGIEPRASRALFDSIVERTAS